MGGRGSTNFSKTTKHEAPVVTFQPLGRIHLTPGLGPRLPLTAAAAEVTQMEADGLLRVAISAEEVAQFG